MKTVEKKLKEYLGYGKEKKLCERSELQSMIYVSVQKYSILVYVTVS